MSKRLRFDYARAPTATLVGVARRKSFRYFSLRAPRQQRNEERKEKYERPLLFSSDFEIGDVAAITHFLPVPLRL